MARQYYQSSIFTNCAKNIGSSWKGRISASALLILYCVKSTCAASGAMQFNTDVLDARDRDRIDLNQFSRAGYLMPGDYQLTPLINKAELPEQTVTFIAPDDDPKGSDVCLSPEIVAMLGLKDSVQRNLSWWHNGQCMDLHSLEGTTTRADLGAGILYLNVPQAYLEYAADNWDPPSRWDNGVHGVLFDYDLNAINSHQRFGGQRSLSGNGSSGINLGAWRLRADWQAQYENATNGASTHKEQSWKWNRYYLSRAVTSLGAKLTLGENNLNSSMFDSFRFTGASLGSDDNQLPPNLRGYAPEVTGVAQTNAKVTISQQGRVLYEVTVAQGPFRIQDISSTISGKLDVTVQEQDGSVKTWQVDTASIPYLSRPGAVRYKISTGKPSDYDHHSQGPEFGSAEFSWGINNGWSIYGGGVLAGNYNALALGLGRDLLAFGAISMDVTQSRAILPQGGTKRGGSYRVSYAKHFDKYDSQVTFAGYRFSERDFMSMTQFLSAKYHHATTSGNGKELYTISLNKQFRSLNAGVYLNYSHQTYWDRPANDSFNGSLATYFDLWDLRGVSLSLSVNRTKYDGKNDDGVYLGLGLPLSNGSSVDYSSQFSGGVVSNNAGYYDRINSNNSYRISIGETSKGGNIGSGYFTHSGDTTEVTANASVQGNEYRALGASLRGGVTATAHGIALHRVSIIGGTRMMVDTEGVAGVPIRGYGGITKTNIFGKAIISDVSSYYRSSVSVDLNELPDNVEATRSVVQDTLTEGAIGYRKFGIISGQKIMAVIKFADGSEPPFGVPVSNAKRVQLGIVGDEGHVWLTGVHRGEILDVEYSGKRQCHIQLPDPLPDTSRQVLLLPCISLRASH